MVVAPLSIPSSVNYLKRRIATIPLLPVPSSHGACASWRGELGNVCPTFGKEKKLYQLLIMLICFIHYLCVRGKICLWPV